MKNIFKRNQVIITALAIMIAIVGYLNFTDRGEKKPVEDQVVVGDDWDSYSTVAGLIDSETDMTEEEILALLSSQSDTDVADDELGLTDISDEDIAAEEEEDGQIAVSDSGELIVVNDEVSETSAPADSETGEVEEDSEETSSPGEAVLVSTTISADYFASTKLMREQNRSKSMETLLSIIDNVNIGEAEKKDAVAAMIALTDISDKENAAELMLEAKGFDDAVVSILEDYVDVVINTPSLTKQQMAQIESVVKRKTGFEAEHIVINPVVVED